MDVSEFHLTKTQLIEISNSFSKEIVNGCKQESSSLDCLPTYFGPATGDESGLFIGLDLGGTNVRALLVQLDGKLKQAAIIGKVSRTLNKAEMTSEDFLFGALADCIIQLLINQKIDGEISIGFTFSFPLEQTSGHKGRILRWAKSFSIPSSVGKDPADLLEKSLIKKGKKNAHIVALINDTTGTLLAGSFFYANCTVATILGTGTNCCVAIPRQMVTKSMGFFSGDTICVNLESGNFNRNLPRTKEDEKIDHESLNRGHQWFEKMVSGLYLGQISGSISTEVMSEIERLGHDHPMLERIKAVSTRSARLAAAAIAGSVLAIDPELSLNHTIAVD